MQEAELAEALAKQAASDLYNAAMSAINKTIATAEACVVTGRGRREVGGTVRVFRIASPLSVVAPLPTPNAAAAATTTA